MISDPSLVIAYSPKNDNQIGESTKTSLGAAKTTTLQWPLGQLWHVPIVSSAIYCLSLTSIHPRPSTNPSQLVVPSSPILQFCLESPTASNCPVARWKRGEHPVCLLESRRYNPSTSYWKRQLKGPPNSPPSDHRPTTDKNVDIELDQVFQDNLASCVDDPDAV